MRRDRSWSFSVRRYAVVAGLAAAAVFCVGLVGQPSAGATASCKPTADGCIPVPSGPCAGTLCPSGASGLPGNSSDMGGQLFQTTNQPPAQTLPIAFPTPAANPASPACIMPETIMAPVAAPGVGFPAGLSAYTITSTASGTFTVCQGSEQLQFVGPAGAALTVVHDGASLTVTLDGKGTAALAASAFGR